MKNLTLLLFLIALVSCKQETKPNIQNTTQGIKTILKYAKGFTVTHFDSHKIIEINNPWPNAEESFTYMLSNNKDEADIINPIKKIVVTSTTHIPALELLGVEQTLVGFPGSDYISSEKTRARIEAILRSLGAPLRSLGWALERRRVLGGHWEIPWRPWRSSERFWGSEGSVANPVKVALMKIVDIYNTFW